MNKKQYMSPSVFVKGTNVQTFLHQASNNTVNTAAVDVTTSTVGVTGALELDNNEENKDVSFAKERSDNGPWESIW